MVNRLK